MAKRKSNFRTIGIYQKIMMFQVHDDDYELFKWQIFCEYFTKHINQKLKKIPKIHKKLKFKSPYVRMVKWIKTLSNC